MVEFKIHAPYFYSTLEEEACSRIVDEIFNL